MHWTCYNVHDIPSVIEFCNKMRPLIFVQIRFTCSNSGDKLASWVYFLYWIIIFTVKDGIQKTILCEKAILRTIKNIEDLKDLESFYIPIYAD